jgi:hypothetical protein
MSFKSIRDTCIEYLNKEDIKRDLKEIIKPIVSTIYNEIYIYILLICFYNVVFISIVLANFILLLRVLTPNNNNNGSRTFSNTT